VGACSAFPEVLLRCQAILQGGDRKPPSPTLYPVTAQATATGQRAASHLVLDADLASLYDVGARVVVPARAAAGAYPGTDSPISRVSFVTVA
jgi:hypothetical protein